MKKLYCAEVTGRFVFVVDTDKVREDRVAEEAYQYLSDTNKIEFYIDVPHEIKNRSDIPGGWDYGVPLGAEEDNDDDCDSYFEFKDEADHITTGLEELGYELEGSFAEDIRKLLKKEI